MLFRAPELEIGRVWMYICKEYARDGHDDM